MEIMNEHGIWSEDRNVIMQVFLNEFGRRFKKRPNVVPSQAISFTWDFAPPDN